MSTAKQRSKATVDILGQYIDKVDDLKSQLAAAIERNNEIADLCDGYTKRISDLEAEIEQWRNEAPYRRAIERAERAEALLREARALLGPCDDTWPPENPGLVERIDAALKEQGGA